MIVAALDLGWSRDHTVLTVLSDDGTSASVLAIDRWQPARDDLADVPARIEANLSKFRPLILGWDATGLGRNFLRVLRGSPYLPPDLGLVPLVVSAGWKPSRQRWDREGAVFLAKQDLVAALFRRFESRSLHVPSLLFSGVLREELAAFQPKVLPDGRRTWAAKPGHHDDTVASLAMAVWLAETIRNRGAGGIRPVNVSREAPCRTNPTP